MFVCCTEMMAETGVQCLHEPREMNSGAAWYSEWPPSPTKLSLSLSLCLQAYAILSPCSAFIGLKKIFCFYIQQKPFIKQSQHDKIVLSETNRNVKSILIDSNTYIYALLGLWRLCTPSLYGVMAEHWNKQFHGCPVK